MLTWIRSFLLSATMMFPSSSTVTPFGRVNSPSFVPSEPRNCREGWSGDQAVR